MRRSIAGIIAPLAVVAAGILLLLSTLGVVAWDIWNDVGRWWPVLVILLGLSVLFQNLSGWSGRKN